MGACIEAQNRRQDIEKALENSRMIERVVKNDWKKEEQRVRLLLLGTEGSGKSTLFTQMKILFGNENGFKVKEKLEAKKAIHNMILDNMKIVLEKTEKYCPLVESSNASKFLEVANKEGRVEIDAELGATIKALWKDDGFQIAWDERTNYQVQDALEYFVGNINRVSANDYIPTETDMLRYKGQTTGVVEEHYMIDGVEFVMFDVGGQRNERKKWIHHFENCTTIIFVTAISDYDQECNEDSSMNRIDEALTLFEEICNSKWFKKTAIILFLNKKDLFAEKLVEYPFRVEGKRFDDFKGPHCEKGTLSGEVGTPEFEKCYNAATKYLLDLFLEKNKQSKEIYSHITCARDTNNIKIVFNACKDIILKANLAGSGFM